MRPKNLTVTDLIAKYQGIDKLHVIEVATFFGAMQAYFLRGYTERVAINSFPSDCMKPEEAQVFWEYYGEEIRGRMIIEILEYPFFSFDHWIEKNRSVRNMNNLFISIIINNRSLHFIFSPKILILFFRQKFPNC
ncbi:MAG: hypothetical protein K5654_02125 [Lachnospiraceae bacterium]|nr:hypothetical protein [Lachnospiraceae bacterium]